MLPFLGGGLDGHLVRYGLLFLGVHRDPVGMVPKLVLFQADLCCKDCLTVGTAMAKLFRYWGLEKGKIQNSFNTSLAISSCQHYQFLDAVGGS